MRRLILSIVAFIAMLAPALAPVFAVEPGEELSDPALEARARELSKGLRCLVCQNQSIDDSAASLAKDLRVVVRERLAAGDTDEEVIDFVVERYGEFVLLKPSFTAKNFVLWAAPASVLVFGAFLAAGFIRAHRKAPVETVAPLTAEEEAALKALHQDDASS